MLLLDEIRLSRDALRYGFAVGKVNVLETRALGPAAFERLLDARTLAEQRQLLSETPYGKYLERAETAEQVERGLDGALEDFYGLLEQAGLPDAVVRYFRIRYDFANLRAVAKARALGANEDGLLLDHGTVPKERFSGDLLDLPDELGRTAAELSGLVDPEPLEVDSVVEKAMFAELVRVAKASRCRYLTELAGLAVDLANVKTLVRAHRNGMEPTAIKELLIGGGSTPLEKIRPLADLDAETIAAALERTLGLVPLSAESFGEVDALDADLDAVTAAAVRRGRMGPVGPDPVISYVLERESEVVALRTILLGTLLGFDREVLRRHVRTIG